MHSEWTYDPEAARIYGASHPRDKDSLPPHHLRCDFMKNGERCIKGAGHERGVGVHAEHEAPKNG